jgi:hypothetical protein
MARPPRRPGVVRQLLWTLDRVDPAVHELQRIQGNLSRSLAMFRELQASGSIRDLVWSLGPRLTSFRRRSAPVDNAGPSTPACEQPGRRPDATPSPPTRTVRSSEDDRPVIRSGDFRLDAHAVVFWWPRQHRVLSTGAGPLAVRARRLHPHPRRASCPSGADPYNASSPPRQQSLNQTIS